MIVVDGLSKWYGPHQAIDDLGFHIPEGAVAGFLGPNGAGKTTTMRILAGSLAATSGEVRIDGVDVFADPLGVKRITGYLPERPPLYEDMTVKDYLAYAATLKRVAKPRQAAARVLDQVDLSHVADRLIGKLSKGFRQRVGLAQALVHSPRVLLLDEPASGLDPTQRVELRRLITHLADGGTTVLLSTHVLGEIEAVCDHVVIIHRGRIRAHGPASALAERVGVRVVVGQSEGLAAQLSAIDGVEAVTQERADTWVAHGPIDLAPAIAQVAVRHELHRLEPAGGLEAAFLRLTQEDA